jgi:adhesin transport system outer membrane protein
LFLESTIRSNLLFLMKFMLFLEAFMRWFHRSLSAMSPMAWCQCCILALPFVATSAYPATWNLDSVLREAVSQHPDVRNRRDERQAASDRLEAARWGRYPSVSGEIQTQPGGPQSVIKMEQPLWFGGRIGSQIDSSQADLKVAGASLGETQLDVLQRSAAAFFEILRLESRLKASQTNEAEHAHLLEIIKRRVLAQVSPKTDETQAAARWYQAKTERIQTTRQLDTARLTLEQLVGLPVGNLLAPERIQITRWNESRLLEAALAAAPERQRLKAQVEAADAQISLAKTQVMPTVVAGYQTRLNSLQFGQQRNQVYIALQAQTGAGLSSFANVRVAVSKKSAAIEAIEAHDRRLTQNVRSTWTETVALADQVEPVRSLLKGSDEIVDSYLRQFQVGRKNWLDVLNAQREKTQASYSLTDLEFPLMLASVKLLLLAGLWDNNTLNISNAP